MKNNLKKNYFVLIGIMVLWVIISFFVVQPQYLKKLYTSISDLVIKDGIILINRNNTKNKLIEKTGVTTIRIYSNGRELSNTEKIKTDDVLKDNLDEYSIAVIGDVNKDGLVDPSDLSKTYKIYKNILTVPKVERLAADSNKDSNIDVSDLSKTYKIYKNLVPDDDDPTPTPQVEYTISFNSNGGNEVQPIKRNSGEAIGILPTPIRNGYTFQGWYTDINAGTRITTSTIVTGNATYYAHWSINQFEVKFINGSIVVSTYTRSLGQQIGTFPTVTKTNYTLDGWYTDPQAGTRVYTTTTVTGNATYYAHWNPAQYTITFDSQGGTACSSISRYYDEQVGSLPSPTKTGYTFSGWYTGTNGSGTKIESTTKVTGNAKYYAKWSVNNYIVSFDGNGGKASPTSITGTYGSTIGTLPTATRNGYSFNGWFTAKTGGTQVTASTTVTGNVTYYAQWTENQCTFDLNGILDGYASREITGYGTADVYINNSLVGNQVTDFYQSYPCSSTYIIRNIKATTGHTFKGDAIYTNTIANNSSVSLPFDTNSYTVTFNSNGGSAVSSIPRKYNDAIGTLPTSTKSGYTFLGWFTAASGGTQISSSTKVTGNVTYYAHWDNYNVLFIGNSKTYYNHMPQLFQKMSQKTGYNARVDMITVGSRNLKNHGLDTPTGDGVGNSTKATKPYIVARLNNTRFDYVILQDQTDASENKSLTLQGINQIKALIRGDSSKSKNAKVINNVIWRKLQDNSTYNGLCLSNTKPVNTAQKKADKIASDIRGNQAPTEIIVRSGRQLFDYECEKKVLDVENNKFHLFREDLNHPEPGGSYLEAGLIYTAIYGKPASKTTIVVGSGWRCSNGNHYNPDTGQTSFPNHNTHTFTASSESTLWDFIIKNYSSYIVK